ncbi:hypothetical protein C1646_716483 [Rhizophagus diaphanus]|nr:hypothetical protein C1646_716483 [Rhizophagus diaphanus] [Rhizophagus sp. MUCL 43196]
MPLTLFFRYLHFNLIHSFLSFFILIPITLHFIFYFICLYHFFIFFYYFFTFSGLIGIRVLFSEWLFFEIR